MSLHLLIIRLLVDLVDVRENLEAVNNKRWMRCLQCSDQNIVSNDNVRDEGFWWRAVHAQRRACS